MELKRLLLLSLISLCSINLYSSELIQITLSDGEIVTGKLDLPTNERSIRELVIFVQSSGPHTYLDKRGRGEGIFNYFDLFVHEFNKKGVGFFVYNRRGVTLGDKPPYYDSIDMEKYKKYLPNIEAEDIAVVINQLKRTKDSNERR